MKKTITAACLFLAAILLSSVAFSSGKPRLILQVTVDQLRGDLPTRYFDRLGDGGFRYLWDSGVVYRDAHHAHANTETIVGHTTLATGAHHSSLSTLSSLFALRSSFALCSSSASAVPLFAGAAGRSGRAKRHER